METLFTATAPSMLTVTCAYSTMVYQLQADGEYRPYRPDGNFALHIGGDEGVQKEIPHAGDYKINLVSNICPGDCAAAFNLTPLTTAAAAPGTPGIAADEFDISFSHHDYCDQNPTDQNDVIQYVEVFMVRVNSTQGTVVSQSSLGYFLHEDMTEPYVPRGAAQVTCDALPNVVQQSDPRRAVFRGPLIGASIVTSTAVLGIGYAVQAIGDENNLPTMEDGEGNVDDLFPGESGSWGADSEAPSRFFETLPKFNLNAGDIIVVTWTEARVS